MKNRQDFLIRSAFGLYSLFVGCSSNSPKDYDTELKNRMEREPYSLLKSNREDGSLFRQTYLFVDSDKMAIIEYGLRGKRSITWFELEPGIKTRARKKRVVNDNGEVIEFVGEVSINESTR